jgi:hypothetical protein
MNSDAQLRTLLLEQCELLLRARQLATEIQPKALLLQKYERRLAEISSMLAAQPPDWRPEWWKAVSGEGLEPSRTGHAGVAHPQPTALARPPGPQRWAQ